jgi:hypothetical protein
MQLTGAGLATTGPPRRQGTCRASTFAMPSSRVAVCRGEGSAAARARERGCCSTSTSRLASTACSPSPGAATGSLVSTSPVKNGSAVDDRCRPGASRTVTTSSPSAHSLTERQTTPDRRCQRPRLQRSAQRPCGCVLHHAVRPDTAPFPRYTQRRVLTGGKAGGRRWLSTVTKYTR